MLSLSFTFHPFFFLENFYYVQFAVENKVSDLVKLSWEFILPQSSGLKQITPKSNQVFIQPRQKRVISFTFKSMNDNGETDHSKVIKGLLRLNGRNEISNVQVLLNSNREVRLDATKEKKTSKTFVISSYDVNQNDKGIDKKKIYKLFLAFLIEKLCEFF